jgi:MFS family permease
VVFTAASALCGLAADGTTLVAARFVQGLGGAFASAVIVATEFPEAEDRARAMSAYMSCRSAAARSGCWPAAR